LEEIIGIGPVRAQRIIEARPFDSLDGLIKVKGIGEKTLQKIKDQGLARVASQEKLEPKPEPEPKPELEPEPDKETIPVSYPTRIVFNEILPSPEGPDAENEWIELYNQNDFEVDLSNWTIQDTTGSTKTYILNSKVPANGYLVLLRPETKITLNNSGDGLNLFNPNGEIVDSVTFGKASLDQSYNKTQSGWVWSTTLTPGAKNIVPVLQAPEQKSKEKKSENGSLEANFPTEKETAVIGEKISKSSNLPFSFLIALVIAISSAVVVLILKNLLSSDSHLGRGRPSRF